jgi:hypothetical protein
MIYRFRNTNMNKKEMYNKLSKSLSKDEYMKLLQDNATVGSKMKGYANGKSLSDY